MFHRVFLDHWMSIFPLVAFLVAAAVYSWVAYRAFRMGPKLVEHFAQLPFNDQIPRDHDAGS